MNNKYINWQDPNTINLLIETLKNGEIFAGTSDTVIGLYANVTEEGYKKLKEVKQRVEKPYIVLVDSIDKVQKLADIPGNNNNLLNFIKNCWPGTVTLIFSAKENLPYYLKSNENTIAIRIPNHAQLLKLLSNFDGLFSTSANISGEKIPQTIEDLNSNIIHYLKYIVVDEHSIGLTPSTILDCTGDRIRVIREGVYPINELEKIYGRKFE